MTDRDTNRESAEGFSRVAPLRLPSDGLVARMALINGADRTLDFQYYLWDSDAVGYLLLTGLIEAADRGVIVRLLVDDMKLRVPCVGRLTVRSGTEETADAIARFMTPDNTWRVEVGADGRLQWRSDTLTLRRQPARSVGQRLMDTLLSHLPIRDYI